MSAELAGPPPLVDAAAYVHGPLCIESADDLDWDDQADVVVVGLGGAGVCAALEARAHGADVLVLERFEGGGATALSGGVYYGGATRQLAEAGFEDSAQALYTYLKLEVEDTVSDATLRRFCQESAANLAWLEQHGVAFGSRVYDGKRWPPDGYDLYYSGNERVAGYKNATPPVPRGHRAKGPNFSGSALFDALARSALAKGVRVRSQTAVARLVVDARGRVVGVEARALPPGSAAARRHRSLIRRVNRYQRFLPPLAQKTARKVAAIEDAFARPIRIRATGGVILSTGSFTFNRAMVQQYAPKYLGALPLGTLGCDGSGVKLGQSLGAAVGRMATVSAWRSIAPPMSFVEGMVVNQQGQRFVSEDVYLGKLGYHMTEEHNGRGWVVVDRAGYRRAFADVWPRRGEAWLSFGLPLLINLLFNAKKGRTLQTLAEACGMDGDALAATLQAYNGGATTGHDALGKSGHYLKPLGDGPYYAIDISIDSTLFPCPTIPMGGLLVDEEGGGVLREDGTPIPGLYGAGRAAKGIPSGHYVSGTSIADCVFSGRRAGRSAARQLEPGTTATKEISP